MPIKDPDARRKANAERMRKRRAEGTAWIDPEKEAKRKAKWYENGGKEKLRESTRQRRQRAREQALQEFTRKLKP